MEFHRVLRVMKFFQSGILTFEHGVGFRRERHFFQIDVLVNCYHFANFKYIFRALEIVLP